MASIAEGGWLSGKKTYITAAVGLIGVVAAYLTGDMGLPAALTGGWIAIQSVFLRQGIAKAEVASSS